MASSAPACLAQVVGAAFVHGEEAHGGAVFRGHVRYGGAVRQREGRRSFPEEFHKFAYHAVAAQHLGDMERQVRGGHSFTEFPRHVDAHYFRHQEGDGWPSMPASASMPPTPQPTTPMPLIIVVWESVPTRVSGK